MSELAQVRAGGDLGGDENSFKVRRSPTLVFVLERLFFLPGFSPTVLVILQLHWSMTTVSKFVLYVPSQFDIFEPHAQFLSSDDLTKRVDEQVRTFTLSHLYIKFPNLLDYLV